MEDYLENMKSLRSYMNDLEEDAAKRSAEEQQQRTAIDAHDTEIVLVRAQVKRAMEEAEQLAEARALVYTDMAEKKGRITALEVECTTLKQTLELLHQEIAISYAKLNDQRLFYSKTMENMTVKLQEQQECCGSLKNKIATMESHVATSHSKQNTIEGERQEMFDSEESLEQLESDIGSRQREHDFEIETAQLKLEGIKSKRSVLLLEMNKGRPVHIAPTCTGFGEGSEHFGKGLACTLVVRLKQNYDFFCRAVLQEMGMKSLEEEYKALQGDKAEETQYFQSLDETIKGMKLISDIVKCSCGLEYKVELGGEAMDIS